jgi:hypothetical protein
MFLRLFSSQSRQKEGQKKEPDTAGKSKNRLLAGFSINGCG